MLLKSLFIVVSIVSRLGYASTGDRLPEFQDCVQQCISNTRTKDVGLLKLLAWDYSSNCDYICQQALTDAFEVEGMRIHQFHGKWPFHRYFGIQELASVVFSMLNLLPNYYGYYALKKVPESEGFYMKPYYLVFALVGINTWLWSSVFHVRDLPVTEHLDYFSAIGQILYGLFLAVVRLLRLDLPSKKSQRKWLIGVLGGFYACHVYYLAFVRFNYAYNMMAGVVIGISQTLMWVYLGMRLYVRGKDYMDLLPVGLVLSVMLGMSFELNDFSPYWRLIDAHSLWHASTVLPTWLWYKWIKYDLKRYNKQQWIRKETGGHAY